MKFITLEKKEYLSLPETPGVYIFRENGKPIYVGKAKNLKSRVSSYFAKTLGVKTAAMVSRADKISYIQVASEFEALILEAKLVKKYAPHYNIELRDDKTPLYIGITDEEFPRILNLRQTQLSKFKLKYTFGPFVNATSVRSLLRKLRRAVPYSTHKIYKKTCVLSEIGLCSPCPHTGLTDKEKIIYKKNVFKIKNILSGKIDKVYKDLDKQMRLYASVDDFENANMVLQQIKVLKSITEPLNMHSGEYLKNPNLLDEIRTTELTELKKYISEFFDIENLNRIECFDIAHIAGSFPTASMVTFIAGEPDKNFYRQFKVNQKKSQSDVDSLREVLTRRSKYLNDPTSPKASLGSGWGTPDLMIIDGGKGQIGVASEIFPGLPVVGLAKRFETLVFLKNGQYYERKVRRGPARNLVQRIRDEAHRFARRYHHKLISKSLIQ